MIGGILPPELAATVSGILAALFLTTSPLFRSRRMMLNTQLAAALSFSAHYAFLDITVASLVNLLGCVQLLAAICSLKGSWVRQLGFALIPAMVLVGLWFWQGPVSAFSVTAMALIALGRMQTQMIWMRGLILAGGIFWICHDYASQAWLALAADIGSVTAGIIGMFLLMFCLTIEWRPLANNNMARGAAA